MKSNKSPKGKKQVNQTPARPEGVTELTEQDLERVQGGQLGKVQQKKWLPANF